MSRIRQLLDVVDRVRRTAREFERGHGPTTGRSEPRTAALDQGTRVEYSPELDGDPDPGEVVWTWVPYEDDPNQGKDRPVVIIGRTGDDLAGVQLTSRKKRRRELVPVGSGGWDPKRRPSYAKVDRLLRIDPDEVRREGAILDRNRFDDVVGNLARYFDLTGRSPRP
ncbi:MAG: type II toxin-antitoxin system PemK/MazF family toxin [Actinomycetota bacterium]